MASTSRQRAAFPISSLLPLVLIAACNRPEPKPRVLMVPDSGTPGLAATSSGAAAKTGTTAFAPPAPSPGKKDGPRYLKLTVEKSLEKSMVEAVGADLGPALAQVAKRELVWWIDPSHGFRRGDSVEILWEPRDTEEPLIHAIWYSSHKLNKKFSAARFQPQGSEFARWYEADGSELELRLKGGPIDSYEQVTSLLSDGRKHKGVDFRCPEGTAVRAPFDGTVVRKNWSTRNNGDCVELEDPKTGAHAIFLHLSSVEGSVTAGARVKKGDLLAKSGNTGHSTAPHLHYQLQQGADNKRLIDPFKFHETFKARLPEAEMPKLKALFERYSALRTSVS
jgi:murein DD-endopeptidase MepM/ murein hydrolase activator NlpD